MAADWGLIGEVIWEKFHGPGGVNLGKDFSEDPLLPDRLISTISWNDKGRNIPAKVTLKNGSTIFFRSCESDVKKFMGTQYDWIWVDEEIGSSEIFQEIQRALMTKGGDLWWTATPLARAPEMINLSSTVGDPDAPIKVHETVLSLLDNPHVSEASKAQFIGSIPEDYLETRIHGAFLIMEGLVYGEWSKNHLVPPRKLPSDWPRTVIIDPGFASPCGVLWVASCPGDPPSYLAYREIYLKKRSVVYIAKKLVEASRTEPVVRVIIDRDAKKKNMAYKNSILKQFNEQFEELRFLNPITHMPLKARVASVDILGGIERVKEFLIAGPNGDPLFRATNNLKYLKQEFGLYMWPKDSSLRNPADRPIDKYNHLLACVRYFLCNPTKYMEMAKTHDPVLEGFKRLQKRKQKRQGHLPGHVHGGQFVTTPSS